MLASTSNFLRNIAHKYPILLFICLTFVWSWTFWIPIHLDDLAEGMTLALTLLGVFGPALAGRLVLQLRENPKNKLSQPLPWKGFAFGAVCAFTALAMLQTNLLGVTELAPKADLTFPPSSPWYVYGLMAVVLCLSGFIFSNTQSSYSTIRASYQGLIPDSRTLLLAGFVLLFLPTILLLSNVIADLIGLPYEQPKYTQEPISIWLPLMVVKLFTVAILTGGNEEHGWRGVLLPLLQKRRSPLVATLIIALIWEPWHLPIMLDFHEGNPNLIPILAARVIAIMPIAFLMTILYNYSRGSTFLCILLHACFNTQTRFFTGSELMAAAILITVITLIIVFKMWRRGTGYIPPITEVPASQ